MNAPQASITLIAPDTYRVSVPLPPEAVPGGFSFNQYLVVDDKPLLFHTGPRKLFGVICEQIEKVMPVADLRYIAFSHVEADECGSLPDFLARAPQAQRKRRRWALKSATSFISIRAWRCTTGSSVRATWTIRHVSRVSSRR